ncbi:ATP phosphoribosyltransferase regulatory subunit [Lachnospiraceae bacterium KM106-2]|nr:ATP phosphoribosyltransferase regulatory subunit [Lachnospiraceae bacterium KM106-2]
MSNEDYKFSEGYAANGLLHTPEGVRDIYNAECEQKLSIQDRIHHVMHLYGFKDIQTPSFEFFDIFNKERGTTPSKEMYKFFDRDNNTLVLRPDITPSIARCAAKYYKEERLPIRFCYIGNTYINNSKYQGKLKETTQVGAELINEATVDADAEMLALCIESLLKVGLTEFRVEVGHADFLNGIIEEAGFNEEEAVKLKTSIENKNIFGVEELVENHDMAVSLKQLILKLPELFGDYDNLLYARERIKNEKAIKAIDRLIELTNILDSYGYKPYVSFDLGMLSKYNYYTGIIFKAYTYGTGDVIVTGGRYDNLVGQFGKKAAAIGLAIVVDQLMIALSRQKIDIPVKENNLLILYNESTQETAIALGKFYRNHDKCVELLRIDTTWNQEEYQAYAQRNHNKQMILLENNEEATVLELSSMQIAQIEVASLYEMGRLS